MATVTDNFNRTENPLSNGGVWETPGTGWHNVQTNGTVCHETTEDSEYGGARVTTAIGNDQYAQVKVTIPGSFGGAGPAVRLQNTTNGGGYLVDGVIDGSHWSSRRAIVERDSAGNNTELATTTDTFASGDTLRLEVSGTTLTAKKNGAAFSPALTATSSTFSSGKIGISMKCNSSTLTNVNLDDFEGGDLSAGGRTTKNTRAFPLGMAIGMNWVQPGFES